jgi:hypothetical protein
VCNNLDLNLWVQNDRQFGTTVVFGTTVALGGVRHCPRPFGKTYVYDRFADDIVRNYQIALATQTTQTLDPATSPQTGQPIEVIHVQNNAPPGGNGSVEHPLNTLAPAAALAGPFGISSSSPAMAPR